MERRENMKRKNQNDLARLSSFTGFWLRVLLWSGTILLLEFYLHSLIYAGAVTPDNYVYIALFSLAYGFLGAALTSLFSRRANHILTVLLLGFITLLYMAQYVYHLFFKTPLLVFSIFNGGQVTEFAGEALRMMARHLPQLLLFLVPVLVVLIFCNRFFSRCVCRGSLLLFGLSILFYGCALAVLPLSGSNMPNSAYNCYYNENNPLPTQQKLGVLTFMGLDARRTWWGFTPKDVPQAVILEDAEVLSDSEMESALNPEEDYNVLDIDFDGLLAEETDPAVQNLHRYFSSLTPSQQNAYTGRFAGKNLIVITAEAFYYPLLETGLFPAVERLATEGFTFTNSYTPLWNVSTSDGEYAVMTSLLPASGVWSFARSAENSMPFALGNQFNALGYDGVYAFHNHTYDYYERQFSHPNMGYTYLARGNGLDITEVWPESDLELMEASIPYYMDCEQFHVYYLTVSGHLEYNFSGNAMAARHQDAVAHLDYSEEVRAYIACNLELEYAIEYLLEQLEAHGHLDDTVIVLSADHYPYGLSDAAIDELVGHPVERNFELYRNTIAIWSADQTPVVIDEPVCSLDILPTISNLFGLPFDSRLMMGRDVFSDAMPLVVFNNRSWITDLARYDATTDTLYGDVSAEYVAAVNEIVNAKFLYSADVLFHDYYRLVLTE